MINLKKIIKDYEVILIDLDNTLFNYTYAHNMALNAVFKNFEISLNDYEKARFEIKKRDLGVNHHKKELYFKIIAEDKKLPLSIVLEINKIYRNTFLKFIKPDSSMLEMIKSAKADNKKVIAITNYYVIQQLEKLECSGFISYIDYLITSEEFEVEKPNKKLFDRAMVLAENPNINNVIMFGDSIADDFGIFGVKYYPYNCSKLLISISGKSGAGKTTISKMLQDSFSCTVIEGDGYHKYERGHEKWKQLTHYNPAANNLIQLALDIKNLYQNIQNINVPIYNHHYGNFDIPNELKTDDLDIVIIEGLHTLYEDVTGDYVKIKMFVDSEYADKQKIIRDVYDRNKSEAEVMDSITKRENDYSKYIAIQKKFANFIIEISQNNKFKITVLNDIKVFDDYGHYCEGDLKELNSELYRIFKSIFENRYVKELQ